MTYEGHRVIIPLQQIVDHDGAAVEVVSVILDFDTAAVVSNIIGEAILSGDAIAEGSWTGVSKRTSPDEPDANLGYDLAYVRAVEKGVNKLAKSADGRVRDNDFQRAHAEQVKENRAFFEAWEAAEAKKKTKRRNKK